MTKGTMFFQMCPPSPPYAEFTACEQELHLYPDCQSVVGQVPKPSTASLITDCVVVLGWTLCFQGPEDAVSGCLSACHYPSLLYGGLLLLPSPQFIFSVGFPLVMVSVEFTPSISHVVMTQARLVTSSQPLVPGFLGEEREKGTS